MKDMVNNPPHYGGIGNEHEHTKCMQSVLSRTPLDGYCSGLIYNVTKYLWRLGQKTAPYKDGDDPIENLNKLTLQDAKKAQWYLNRLVEYLETGKVDTTNVGHQHPRHAHEDRVGY